MEWQPLSTTLTSFVRLCRPQAQPEAKHYSEYLPRRSDARITPERFLSARLTSAPLQ